MKLKQLFSPITIGNIKLNNRLVMLAMAPGYAENGKPTKRLEEFLVERAKGGVGLIITSINVSYISTMPTYLCPTICDDSYTADLRTLVDVIHSHGVPVVAELLRLHLFAKDGDALPELAGPSGITVRRNLPSRSLTIDEIHQMVEEYGEGARRAREAGFDGVEIVAGAGGILSQFLSDLTNKRNDKYGGSFENKTRMLVESVEASRKKAGDDYPIGVRYSASEFIEGGYDISGGKEIAQVLEKAGVAWIDLQVGWHESPIPLITKEVPEGHWAYLSKEIKDATRLPVITGYRITDPVVAEKIVASGKADLIGMARALLADPELPNKAKSGDLKDIRYCICCCRCIDAVVGREIPLEICTVNPRMGQDMDVLIEATSKPKKVVIVGGGPGGMEVARVAALRGHKPVVFERSPRLGGLMVLGSILNPEVEKMMNYQKHQIKKLGIETILNTEATLEIIESQKPDVVVLAVGGGIPSVKVSGDTKKNVIGIRDASKYMLGQRLNKRGGFLGPLVLRYFYRPSYIRSLLKFDFPFGKRVVIVGGKFAGIEFAEALSEKGKKITVLEESRRIGSDIGPSTRFIVLGKLRNRGVKMEANTKVLEITSKGVKAVNTTGEQIEIAADTVIITADLVENKGLAQQLNGKFSEVYLIGDATERLPITPPNIWGPVQPRRIGEAVKAGYQLAVRI